MARKSKYKVVCGKRTKSQHRKKSVATAAAIKAAKAGGKSCQVSAC